MKRVQSGFTLVELMIVVAIIGILAAVAVPAYNSYSTKAKVANAIASAASVKTGVSEYFNSNGALPSSNSAVGAGADGGADLASTYIASIAVGASGVITITYKTTAVSSAVPAALSGQKITLTPSNTAGIIKWTCTSDLAAADKTAYMPADCKG